MKGAALNNAGPAVAVEAEETVFAGRYSNNGAGPMWCYGNTCIVRSGTEVFVSATERLPGSPPLNDCRWVLMQRAADGWVRRQADDAGRQREPCPLGCLPPGRIALSSNPTLTAAGTVGGGPARPEILLFDGANPQAEYRAVRPAWQGTPGFSEHSYRTLAVDGARGELVLFQNAGFSHAEWALLERSGRWRAGQLAWPAYAATDLAPFGASHARINYPVVMMRDRAVHFCGCAAYDNWDRVRTVEDLGLGGDPNRPGASGMAGRQRGSRTRRLLYAWTAALGDRPFGEWHEVDNTFADGGWLFPGDLHLDGAGRVHLLWYRAPMLRSLRDAQYPGIPRVYSLEYAVLSDGKLARRQTLVRAGDGHAGPIPTDTEREGWPYVLVSGERIVGDPPATPRFHATPDGRLFVVYYASAPQSEATPAPPAGNRILEVRPDGAVSPPVRIPLAHPLTQFFTATPRAGCAPSWTLDLLGHRRGDWRPAEGTDWTEWDGTLSYARVRIRPRESET